MSEIKKLKINGQEYTITDGGAVAFDEAQELNEEQKEQARENIGAGSGVYVLGEGETEADVPEGVDVLIDPNGEPLVIPQTLIVTIENDVASHTSTEIYAHVMAGGTAVLYDGIGYITLARLHEECASFGWVNGEEVILTHFDVYEDGSFDAYRQLELASGEYVRGYTYSKSQIDTMLGSYINDIDTLLGGES